MPSPDPTHEARHDLGRAAIDDWPERLRARTRAAADRRRRRADERGAATRRRAHGLIDRHALRLAEVRARRSPPVGIPPDRPD